MIAGKPPSSGDDRECESFAGAMRDEEDVTPLAEAGAKKTPVMRSSQARQPAGDPESPSPFHYPVANEPLLGHRPGLRKSELRRLRAGKLRPEVVVDLHGLDRASARAFLREEIASALRAEWACVLVIHGRGRGSDRGEPVLRRSLPNWLAERGLQEALLAFAPASPRDGGRGATYLMLRRE